MERRSLVGYVPWGHREADMAQVLRAHTHTHIHDIRKNSDLGPEDIN